MAKGKENQVIMYLIIEYQYFVYFLCLHNKSIIFASLKDRGQRQKNWLLSQD